MNPEGYDQGARATAKGRVTGILAGFLPCTGACVFCLRRGECGTPSPNQSLTLKLEPDQVFPLDR